jgi:uncharacterized protein YijF (DUF1287 family)
MVDDEACDCNPLILHNLGRGPQIEDALFVGKIIGHFRYSGLNTGT